MLWCLRVHFSIHLPLNPHLLTPGVPSLPPVSCLCTSLHLSLRLKAWFVYLSVLAIDPGLGTPNKLSNTPELSGGVCHLEEPGGPSLGSRVEEEPVLQRGCSGDSYQHRLEVSIRKPFHLEIWLYKVELIDELIISTDTI